MPLEIRHVTQYHYAAPVRESVMEVWMQPQKTARQRLVSFDLELDPPAQLVDLLLAQLSDVPDEHRQAHFACAAAFARPDGKEHVLHGRLPGTLIRSPRGANGFGYDPIFCPDGERRTSAELTAGEKDAISHRGRAFRALAAELPGLL